MMYKCELVDYFDVWGNPEDGWEVNNLSRENTFYMKHDYTDKDMINKLIEINYLKPDASIDDFEMYDDGEIFEAFGAEDQVPLFRVELKPIRPIATLGLTNFGGIAILEVDERNEEITYQYYDNEPETVQYDYEYNEDTDEFETFFMIGDEKYYFHEFVVA